ncbi:MAG: GGDEF domain-containing protein [Sulfurimonas sp.]
MSHDERTLQIISNEIKDTITQLGIVTPSIYASLFSQEAKKYNIDIEDETAISADIIQTQCSSLQKLQKETSKNAKELSEHTSKAITAIESNDTESLKQVLEETKALRLEIEKLKESVYKDELTHAYNRKWFHDHYINEHDNTLNKDGNLVVIDLNYFKQINDTYGHIIGDKVLIFITNQLKKITKKVIRYGGDEFIILFLDQETDQIQKSIEKLRESILTKKLKAHDAEFRVSFSYGLSPFTQGSELSKIIEKADKLMYEDKVNIKKRVQGIHI